MYKLIRFFLFLLPTETSHYFAMSSLKLFHCLGLARLVKKKSYFTQTKEVFGIKFLNPVGIAAGIDKDGDYIDAIASLGVGFIELGGVTPKAQVGNPKPRLLRLKKDQALINRMGFNNKGVDYLVKNLQKRKTNCLVGVNLAKNKDTPLALAKDDYIYCLQRIYNYCDFVTINISSPNTPNLRKLQTAEYLQDLLQSIKNAGDLCCAKNKKYLPLLVKIAPDLKDEDLYLMLDTIKHVEIDGLIACNSSVSRDFTLTSPLAKEAGGLSGKPIQASCHDLLKKIKRHSPKLPVISVGGIDSAESAKQRMDDGAALVQVFTGLIYQGTGLIDSILCALQRNN